MVGVVAFGLASLADAHGPAHTGEPSPHDRTVTIRVAAADTCLTMIRVSRA